MVMASAAEEALVHRAQITDGFNGFSASMCFEIIFIQLGPVILIFGLRMMEEMKLLMHGYGEDEIIDESHRSGRSGFPEKFADSYGNGSRGNGLEEL